MKPDISVFALRGESQQDLIPVSMQLGRQAIPARPISVGANRELLLTLPGVESAHDPLLAELLRYRGIIVVEIRDGIIREISRSESRLPFSDIAVKPGVIQSAQEEELDVADEIPEDVSGDGEAGAESDSTRGVPLSKLLGTLFDE